MNGRVKTLHPNIFAGILSDRDNPDHIREIAEKGIKEIDLVIVNLYPGRCAEDSSLPISICYTIGKDGVRP